MIVKEAMANGRLAGTEAPAVVQEIAADAGARQRRGRPGTVLHQPWAGVVLSGAATVDQLAGNLHAAVVDLDEEGRARLDALVEEPEAYWRHRAGLRWS